ncbi:MAG: 2-C-methyl-D-erythritol 2,4-cyclodiphosphate synthase [Puniceicoccales bacterium]|nr:2-C-methyl-D-erythritol 2,4-cyclodiphosphate synthase [Puniceicoccales bacterium]
MLRVGLGRDVHRLVRGRRLILGGVCVDEDRGCVAHSDGDCLAHALMDALLGAAALPNVGVLFPNTDEANRGRNSLEMMEEVVQIVLGSGLRVANVDAVIQLETPILQPFMEPMRKNLSRALSLDGGRIGLKATTAEGLGPVGAGEAVEVCGICLLEARG